jgi:hypothetical protein
MRACFLDQNVIALGNGIAGIQFTPVAMSEPPLQPGGAHSDSDHPNVTDHPVNIGAETSDTDGI